MGLTDGLFGGSSDNPYRSQSGRSLDSSRLSSQGLYGIAQRNDNRYAGAQAQADTARNAYGGLLSRGLTDTDRSAYINNQLGNSETAYQNQIGSIAARNPDGGDDSFSRGLTAAYGAARASGIGQAANQWNDYARNYQMNAANQNYGLYNNEAQDARNAAMQGYGQSGQMNLSQASGYGNLAQQQEQADLQRRQQVLGLISGGLQTVGNLYGMGAFGGIPAKKTFQDPRGGWFGV